MIWHSLPSMDRMLPVVVSAFFIVGCVSLTPDNRDQKPIPTANDQMQEERLEDALSSSTFSVHIGDEESSLTSSDRWKNYENANMGFRIAYPSDEYTVSNTDSTVWFGDEEVTVNGVRIGDGVPEGNGVLIYWTNDRRILDFLQQEHPFVAQKTVNGIEYQEYYLGGMGETYGYVTKRGDTYYVLHSMWGPDNAVTEDMLESLRFE